MKKYEKLMYKFSLDDLKNYAGEKYIDTLIEWVEESSSIYERGSLINIVKIVHGTKIFKNKNHYLHGWLFNSHPFEIMFYILMSLV